MSNINIEIKDNRKEESLPTFPFTFLLNNQLFMSIYDYDELGENKYKVINVKSGYVQDKILGKDISSLLSVINSVNEKINLVDINIVAEINT